MQFRIDGMDCAEEIAVLRRELGPLVGGEERMSFDILNRRMSVRVMEDSQLTSRDVVEAVSRTGMTAIPLDNPSTNAKDVDSQRRKILLLATISGLASLAGFIAQVIFGQGLKAALASNDTEIASAIPLVARLLYCLAIVAGVWTFVPKAWLAARRLRPDMNLLMVVAVCGAIYLGDWLEAAMVAFLFTLSLALESWSIGRARRAVAALLNLTPPSVLILSADGSEKDVTAADVAIGTRFIVRAGQRIPLDGRITSGTSEINQAPLTGESVPISKTIGDEVYAGTVNGNATIEVESTNLADQTAVANIIRLVGEAQSNRAPSEQWVDSCHRADQMPPGPGGIGQPGL